MKELLHRIIMVVARIHEKFLTLNDRFEYNFSDKQLHFYIIGVLGMCMIFVIHPIFNYLAKKKLVMAISWIYVLTVLIVITFAIEIGQGWTHTGVMEFADIQYGLLGFFWMFGIFEMIRLLVKGIVKLVRDQKQK